MVAEGSSRCQRCLKGKKGCHFPVEGEVDLPVAVSKSPVASIKKFISSPIKSLRKRKEADLSPESQKEKAATSSTAIRTRKDSPSPELGGDAVSIVSMPPPSSIITSRSGSSSARYFFPSDDYRVQLLQTALRESQEDLTIAQDRFASKESLYLGRIAALESQMGKRGSSSKGRK